MSVSKRDYLSMLQTLLVIINLNDMAKIKLAILPFLCCGEIMKNSNVRENKDEIFRFEIFISFSG